MLNPLMRACGLGACVILFGCLGSPQEKKEQASQLAECSGDSTDAEVQDNILITEEFAGSLATSMQLAWLPVLFTVDFAVLLGQTIGGLVGGTPVGWVFDNGTYTLDKDTGTIVLTVSTTVDSGYGPSGTVVSEDVFALSSYFVGAAIETDSETNAVTITYESPGPLIELLGLGPAPASPLTLSEAEQQTVVDSLSTLAIEPVYVSKGVTPHLTWELEWTSPKATVAEIAAGEIPIDLELVGVQAAREDLEQTLDTEEWQIQQRNGDVDGYTTFTVKGGYFDYRGRVDLSSEAFTLVIADRELDCP